MRIAVASGKGGTGKTTIAVSLASYLAKKGARVYIYDCDVEEPNVNLFLKSDIHEKRKINIPVPEVDKDLCDGCGVCERICQFSAIVMINGKPLIFPDMCHSCGGCMLACPKSAIEEVDKEIGVVEEGSKDGIFFSGGRLKIGQAMSPPLIRAVKQYCIRSYCNIIDSPPGTSCPVIESISDTDYVILATEPTPFGFNDLALAVDMVRAVNIPFGVFINRSDIGDSRVLDYCRNEGIEVIASIPESREIAEAYSRGDVVNSIIEGYSAELEKIIEAADIDRCIEGVR